MDNAAQQIKERLGIVDVVSAYVELERAGKNFRARCPFHNERTPSFFISPDRESFHCFGCGKGGDVFTFVQEIEGLDFSGALQELAQRAGVEVRRTSGPARDQRERLFACLEKATEYFENRLKNHPEVGAYLSERGLLPDTIAQFRIGFAPKTWHSLSRFLTHNGFTDTEIEQSGLALSGRYGLYDRFRGRIMFPITDSAGRVIAFSGRVFGELPPDSSVGKYINSPETPVYTKSHVLYGFDKAKTEIRREDACVFVEGQFDVCAAHQAGTLHTVAASGTALSEEHLVRVGRLTKTLVFAFDADNAGIQAAVRGAQLALAHDFTVQLVALPEGKDPADYAIVEPEGWRNAVSSGVHIVSFLLARFKEKYTDSDKIRAAVSEQVVPLIARITNAIERAHYTKEAAAALGISEDAVSEEVRRARGKHPRTQQQEHQQSAAKQLQEDRMSMIEREILGILSWQSSEEEPRIAVAPLTRRFEELTGEPFEERKKAHGEERMREHVFAAEQAYAQTRHLQDEVEALLYTLEELQLRRRREQLEAELRQAESAGDTKRASALFTEYNTLSRAIDTLASRWAFKQ